MQNRVSLYPGRVILTPVSGQENTYDMVRADEPTQEGTPLNKATLLSDETASALELSQSNPTVNDALYKLFQRSYSKEDCLSSTTAALYGLPDTAVPDEVLAMLKPIVDNIKVAVDKCGNCEIYTTSYVGTGTSGSSTPNTLTFPKAPVLVLIHGGRSNAWGVYAEKMALLLRGSHIFVPMVNNSNLWPTTWSADGKTVSWYAVNATADDQINASGSTYTVIALWRRVDE